MGHKFSPFIMAVIMAILSTSCIQGKGTFDANFELEGFVFDVNAPEVRVNTPSLYYTNQINVPLRVITGSNKSLCESLTHYDITESITTPAISEINRVCVNSGYDNITYSLLDTSEGPKSLYAWGANKNQSTLSSPALVNLILDLTGPSGTLSDASALVRGGNGASHSITASDNYVLASILVEISQDGSTWLALSNPATNALSTTVTYPAWDTSNARLRMILADAAENTTTVTSSLFTIDSTPPTLSINNLPTYVAGSSNQNITFSATDLNGVFETVLEYTSDGTNYTLIATNPTSPHSWTVPITETNSGRIRLRATDNAGNSSSTTTAIYNVDSTAPTASMTAFPSALRAGSAHSITWSASDASGIANASLEYAADGATYASISASATSPYSWSVPVADTTASRVRLTITDGAGNVSVVVSNAFNIDNTAPTASINNLAAAILGGSSQSVTFSHSDTNGVASWLLEYAADGTSYTALATTPASPYSWSVPSVNTSASKLRLTVTDNLGWSTQVETSSFAIDSSGPTLSINNLASVIRGGSSQSVTYTYSDPNGVTNWLIEYAADGTNFSTIATSQVSPYSWSVPVVDTLNSRLRISATDSVGNTSSVQTSIFDIDSTAPTLSLNNLAAEIQGGSNTNVTFTHSDLHGVSSWLLEYAADGSTFSTLATDPSSPYSWSVPASNTTASRLRLTATDSVGNSTSITNATFNIDSTNPSASINNLAAAIRGGSSQSITFSSSDASGVSTWSLAYAADGTNYTTIATDVASPYSWSVPVVDTTGSKLRLSVTDTVGNSTQVETAAFNIDSTPPTTTITDLASVIRGGVSNSVAFSNSDANGISTWTLEFAADGVTFASVATDVASAYSWSTPALNTSASLLRITTTDSVGNTNTDTTSAFAIDSTPPTLSINDLASVIQGGSVQSVTFSTSDLHGVATWSLAYAADGVTFTTIATDPASPYSWSVPLSNTSGSRLRLSATDSVGNSTSITNSVFNIDSTPTTPALTPNNFASATATNVIPLTLTAANCTDIAQIMLQESSTAPTAASPGWQSCSTAAGALSFDASITNQQGFRTLRAYGIDAVGNISAPQLISFIYDTEAPIMVFENIPTLASAIEYPIEWTLTEASIDGTDNFTLEYSLDNGATWTLEATIPVGVAGPHSNRAYSYTWTVPGTLTTQAIFRIALTDNNGQTGNAQSNVFTILLDPDAPNFLVGEMTINGSSTPPATASKYVNVSFEALDAETNITHFCLKVDATAPTLSDSCWRAVDAPIPGLTPSPSLVLVNYPHLLGYVPAIYTVYAWARDLKGNISTNTASVGKDIVTITYDLDTPPVLSNFFVSNTTTPPNPITDAEMIFNLSDPVHIKWTATDDKGISPTIELHYTTDDVNYTLITNTLSNGLNNCSTLNDPGTTLDDSSTGCYLWSSPFTSSQYFRLRLVVTDTANQATSTLSLPLNSDVFRVLAGNVDPGIDSSAKSAMLNPIGQPSLYSLAVASDGKIFFNDGTYGLLYINPQTGVLEQLLKETGTYSGDLGPVRDATAVNIFKITMDYDDRLLIWDGQRIRRVDTKTEPMQIETIIGGYNNGALGTETSDIVTEPADLLISNGPSQITLFQPMPNGDIYFQSGSYGSSVNSGNVLRVYRGSLGSPDIQTIRINGTGASATNNGIEIDMDDDTLLGYFLTYDVNTSSISSMMAKFYRPVIGCSYYTMASVDTVTYTSLGLSTDVPNPHPPAFVSTCGDYYSRLGLDGKMYRLGANVAWQVKVSRYNLATNDYTNVLGVDAAGSEGYCADGTPATSCKIKVSDFFVTSSGQFFMVDNGTIRVIDSAGNVQTLYGQTKTYGDGGLAQDARFNSVPYMDHGTGDNVIIYDSGEKVLREIKPNEVTSQIINLAGNGETGSINFANPASGQTLNGNSWDQPGAFVTDPTSGDTYFPCVGTYICRLDRATGLWEQWAGGGATSWLTTGTVAGSAIQMGGYNKGILSAYNGKFLTGHYSWSGTQPNNSSLREFDMTTADSTFIAGKAEEDGATGCPDGAGVNCNLNANRSTGRAFTFHTGANQWLYEHNSNVIKYLSVSGTDGSITTFDTMAEGISSMVWNTSSLYYCSDGGLLKRKDYPSLAVVTLAFPNSSIRCYGSNMLFKPASGGKPDRLVFPFTQNGLTGIAEYFLN